MRQPSRKVNRGELVAILMLASYCILPPAHAGDTKKVQVTVDTSRVPELADWATQAKQLCEKHYPGMVAVLLEPSMDAPREVALVFDRDMEGVAHTDGATITIAANWVKEHPDDLGMVIHELAHVVQSYPNYDPSWLVEGLADYVRFWMYEPASARPKVDPAKANYTDSYRTTAAFLAWLAETYGPERVTRISVALREDRYEPALFSRTFGHTLDELWAQFTAGLSPRERTENRGSTWSRSRQRMG